MVKQLNVRTQQIDLLGNVEISIPIGSIQREAWEKMTPEQRGKAVISLFQGFTSALTAPESVGIPDKVQEYRP